MLNNKFARVDIVLALLVIVVCAAIGSGPLTLVGGIAAAMLTTSRWSRSGLTFGNMMFSLGAIVGLWFVGGLAGLCLRAGFLLGSLFGFAAAVAVLVGGAWVLSRYVNLRWKTSA